jgi:hypothetical protein
MGDAMDNLVLASLMCTIFGGFRLGTFCSGFAA